MPTMTRLMRDGEPVKCSWTFGHCGMLLQFMEEENSLPEYIDSELFPDTYVFRKDHSWTVKETELYTDGDPDKTETFEVKAGDIYECWYSLGR